MPALEAGASAPEIDLPLLAGGKFSLAEARKAGPVVVAFYKVSCPVCQLAFPYLERIYKAYSKSPNFTFAGVSQDNPQDTNKLAEVSGVAPSQIFQPGESVPDHRPG